MYAKLTTDSLYRYRVAKSTTNPIDVTKHPWHCQFKSTLYGDILADDWLDGPETPEKVVTDPEDEDDPDDDGGAALEGDKELNLAATQTGAQHADVTRKLIWLSSQ